MRRTSLFLAALLAVLLAGCRRNANVAPPIVSRWPVMSTIAELSLPASQSTNASTAQQIVAAAFSRVERDLSVFRPASEIARINQSAGSNRVTDIARDTAEVLACALRVARESGGAFDPTVSPLMKLWGFRGGATGGPPAEAAIRATRDRVGWRHVRLAVDPATDPPRASISLDRPGMQLDLGGIAKGFAVDRASDALRRAGVGNFLVNLAGNMRGLGGPHAGRQGWRIGIRDPARSDAWIGTVTLADGEGIATSGSYERFVVLDGRRYAHIIDPRSGHPVAGILSVTVLAPSAMEADALSTALFVLGPDAGRGLLIAHPGCQAVYLLDTQPPRLLATAGLRTRLVPAPAWRQALQWLD